jgi:hypothetical protein
MKTYWGRGGKLETFLTSALDGGEWLSSPPGRFTTGERAPGTHWIENWADSRADLDAVAKINDPFPAPVGNRTPVVQSVA